MPVATNVAAGKPAVNGAIWTAPLGSILPTDALTEMTAIYALTTDTALVTGKTYYTKSGTTYTAVAEPSVANIATYYERRLMMSLAMCRTTDWKMKTLRNPIRSRHGAAIQC